MCDQLNKIEEGTVSSTFSYSSGLVAIYLPKLSKYLRGPGEYANNGKNLQSFPSYF